MKNGLQLDILKASYGDTPVLEGVSIKLRPGESVGIIGPNGSGKTSVLRVLTGSPSIKVEAKLRMDGAEIPLSLATGREHGIAYVPQYHRVFPNLSISENVYLGWTLSPCKETFDTAYSTLQKVFPLLSHKDRLAGRLSGGEQQIVSLARALAQKPHFLVLDEPTVGVSPRMVKSLLKHLGEIRETLGVGFLIVEHNLEALLGIVDRIYVISEGKVALEGAPSEIRSSQLLRKIYFGDKDLLTTDQI